MIRLSSPRLCRGLLRRRETVIIVVLPKTPGRAGGCLFVLFPDLSVLFGDALTYLDAGRGEFYETHQITHNMVGLAELDPPYGSARPICPLVIPAQAGI